MQLTTALTTTTTTTVLLAALTTATPLPEDTPDVHFTTISLQALHASHPISGAYVSAHHGRLYLNATTPADADAVCSNAAPPPPYATFLVDNATTTLRLYNGPAPAQSWQQVYDDWTNAGLSYATDPAAPPLTDTFPTYPSGWTLTTTPTAGGAVVDLLYQGAPLWACDVDGHGRWMLDNGEWGAYPIGTTGCVEVVTRVVREEPAVECVYSASY